MSNGFEVRWTRTTNEAKDDAECFCGKCDEYIITEDWNYCPYCGVELIYRNDMCHLEDEELKEYQKILEGLYKSTGVKLFDYENRKDEQ